MKVLLYWLPAVIWAGVIFYLSGRTGEQLHHIFPFFSSFDWGHLAAYFVLSLFVAFALDRTCRVKEMGFRIWVVFICFLYGVSDELHQYFVPGRSPQWTDLVNDLAGASLAVLLYPKIKLFLGRRKYRRGEG